MKKNITCILTAAKREEAKRERKKSGIFHHSVGETDECCVVSIWVVGRIFLKDRGNYYTVRIAENDEVTQNVNMHSDAHLRRVWA